MQFDFSRFLLDIEHRARRFQGLSLACRLMCYGSLASITAILSLRWLTPGLGRGVLLLALLIPAILAGVAFVLGWWKRPNLPRLLLSLDDELQSGARISSLYEERLRGHDSFFRQRLETLVKPISEDWKRGLRLPCHTLRFLSAGLSGILIAGILLVVPLPLRQAGSMESSAQSETSSTQGLRSTAADREASAASDEPAVTLEPHEQIPNSSSDSSDEAPLTLAPNEELSLESVLEELSDLSRGQAQVRAPITSDELLDLANAQDQARQALSDMLQDIQQKMDGSPRLLTRGESAGLQELAAQIGDSSLEQATRDLTDETDPAEMEERMQDLMDKIDPNASDPGATPETNDNTEDGSSQDAPQSTEVSGDEEAGQKFLEQAAQRMEEQANAESQQEGQTQQPANQTDQEDSQEPGQDGAAKARMAGDPDDLAQVGGEDGLGGDPSDGPQPGDVGFVQEEAPSTIGEEGDFVDEFVTKGVPIEMAPLQDGVEARFVDFDRMNSILQNRGLPDEAQASIRRYFELITQSEGGS